MRLSLCLILESACIFKSQLRRNKETLRAPVSCFASSFDTGLDSINCTHIGFLVLVFLIDTWAFGY